MNLQQAFANRVVFLRDKAGLTQVELAERMGLTQSAISKIESGQNWLRPEMLAKLADALGVTPAKLFQNNSEKPPK